jgi:hypothetical protein
MRKNILRRRRGNPVTRAVKARMGKSPMARAKKRLGKMRGRKKQSAWPAVALGAGAAGLAAASAKLQPVRAIVKAVAKRKSKKAVAKPMDEAKQVAKAAS